MIEFFLDLASVARANPNIVFQYDVRPAPLSVALAYDQAAVGNLKDLPREWLSIPEQLLINILIHQPQKNGRYLINKEYQERVLFFLSDILPGRIALPPEQPGLNLRYLIEPTKQNCKVWVDFAAAGCAALREVPKDRLSAAERVFINFLAGVPINGGCFFVGQHALARMYYFLAKLPQVSVRSGNKLVINNFPLAYRCGFAEQDGRYEFILQSGAGEVLHRKNCQLIGEKNFVLFHAGAVYTLDYLSAVLFERYLAGGIFLESAEVPRFTTDCLPVLSAAGLDFTLPDSLSATGKSVLSGPAAPVLEVLGEKNGRLTVKIKYDYGLQILPEYRAADNADFYTVRLDGQKYFLKRDKKSEDWLHDYLGERRFTLERNGYVIEHDDFVDFMTYEFPGLQKNIGLKVWGEHLEQYVYADQEFDIDLDFHQSSGIDWFEFAPVYKVKDTVFTHEQIQRLITEDKEYARLKDGSLVKIPRKEFAYLQSYLEGRSQKASGGKYQVKKYDLYYLYSGVRDQMKSRLDDSLRALLERLEDFSGIPEAALPAGVRGEPRRYQLQGYYWLQFLHDQDFHGILADDMGLGKTLQV
ncbi:MAG: SNF2 helicase associated domain-containing protein, partial [Candidatus Margulisbacteria bacterium]|nr:SNF2 helicase associated domain-containing protein [Candidatus Margulisiibacteriota bacterium]